MKKYFPHPSFFNDVFHLYASETLVIFMYKSIRYKLYIYERSEWRGGERNEAETMTAWNREWKVECGFLALGFFYICVFGVCCMFYSSA